MAPRNFGDGGTARVAMLPQSYANISLPFHAEHLLSLIHLCLASMYPAKTVLIRSSGASS